VTSQSLELLLSLQKRLLCDVYLVRYLKDLDELVPRIRELQNRQEQLQLRRFEIEAELSGFKNRRGEVIIHGMFNS
jgi:hypothetical protein